MKINMRKQFKGEGEEEEEVGEERRRTKKRRSRMEKVNREEK